jgi:hypothetical protein
MQQDVYIGTSMKTQIESVHERKKATQMWYLWLQLLAFLKKKQDTNKHVAFVYEGKKPFKCDICEYICYQKGDLNTYVFSYIIHTYIGRFI